MGTRVRPGGSPVPRGLQARPLILQRAAEIDARGDSLTVEELKRIANEARIDPLATETAIQQVVAEEEPAPVVVDEEPRLPAKKSLLPSPGWIVTGGAIGAAMGFLTALPQAVGMSAVGVSAFGGTVLYLVLRAVQSMKRGAQLDFQLQNFAVWFGMAMGGTALGASYPGEIFGVALLFWIVTSVVGGLLVRFGPREEEAEDEVPRIGPGKP